MDDWPIIFSYTRGQAIADGVLIDVTAQAAEVGFKVHTVVTDHLYNVYAVPPAGLEGDVYQHGILTPLRAKSASKIDPLGSPLRCLGSPEAQGVPRGDADSGDDQKGPAGGATRWKIH